MLVIAAKISLFHVFRKMRWAIFRRIKPIKATMAKIIPKTSFSFAGTVTYLTFLRLFSLDTATF